MSNLKPHLIDDCYGGNVTISAEVRLTMSPEDYARSIRFLKRHMASVPRNHNYESAQLLSLFRHDTGER